MQADLILTLFHCLTPTLPPLERFQTAFCSLWTGLANVPVDHLHIVRSHGNAIVDYDGAEVGGWVGAEVGGYAGAEVGALKSSALSALKVSALSALAAMSALKLAR